MPAGRYGWQYAVLEDVATAIARTPPAPTAGTATGATTRSSAGRCAYRA